MLAAALVTDMGEFTCAAGTLALVEVSAWSCFVVSVSVVSAWGSMLVRLVVGGLTDDAASCSEVVGDGVEERAVDGAPLDHQGVVVGGRRMYSVHRPNLSAVLAPSNIVLACCDGTVCC